MPGTRIQAKSVAAVYENPVYEHPASEERENHEEKIIDYYRSATTGYRDWSRNINMHFGFYEWGMNPLNLEAMLENTNRQVLNALQLEGASNHLLDMGCGVGATARFCAAQDSVAAVTGITLVDTQIEEAKQLSEGFLFGERLHFRQANYHCTPFAENTFDGVYAIESACHSEEINKHSLLVEALRVLKPGARLVICDGLIKSRKPFNPLLQYCYDQTCKYWSLGHFAELGSLLGEMEKLGFKNIAVRNISLRIAPSAAFIPWISLKFFIKLLITGDKNPQHWSHLLAPIYSIPLALSPNRFGYYLITGEK